MISFIVIGRNEGLLLSKCFQSIFEATHLAGISDFEIIYVDSNSTDNSVEAAMQFTNIRIYKITKNYSPAAGRNVGAEMAKGDVLFFIDGDMQIHEAFLQHAIDEKGNLRFSYCSGNCWYQYYDAQENFLREDYYYSKREKTHKSTMVNGIFLIEKKLWFMVGGMDERFPLPGGEDHDLFIRLRNKGILFYRLPQRIATVHIYDYTNLSIVWKKFFKGNTLYGRSFLYRKNIFRWPTILLLFQNEKSLLLLLISFLALFGFKFGYFFIFYFLFFIFKSLRRSQMQMVDVIMLIFYFFLRDIAVVMGFVFLFPRKRNKVYLCIR